MCGIFGAVALQRPLGNAAERVVAATELLRHRGPDGGGQYDHERFSFGHRRLSIVDLDDGAQPMQSPERDGIITYNGELYNHLPLRKLLQVEGRRFQTDHSDTEVLLQAILHWGVAGLCRLRGMYAFAVADLEKQRIVIARDRVGKKPLFYTIQDGALWFSSELEPLWSEVGPFKLDRQGLDQYLTWQYVPAPRTIYQDVSALPPGHYLDLDLKAGTHKVERYWSLNFQEDGHLTPEDWETALDKKLREAVEIRLMSDVPYGAFLSGGIDSSLVVGYMSELLDRPVRSFSIGFEETDFSELKYAQVVASICKTQHSTEIVKAESLALLPMLARHFGQPFADSSAIPTYYVSRMARRDVTMVLSGDGGDESFAGYNTYPAILSRVGEEGGGQPQGLALQLLSKLLPPLRRRYPSGQSPLDAHAASYQHFSQEHRQRLYKSSLRDLATEDILPGRDEILFDESKPLVSRLQALDVVSYLCNDILMKVDIVAMANSLEVRCPLLDHEVMELASTMPAGLKLNWEPGPGYEVPSKKHLLKQLAIRRFPKEVIERPKKGFGIPLGTWFANELKDDVQRRLMTSQVLPELFDMNEIQRLIDAHDSYNDHSPRLWNLLFLEEWLRSHARALG